MRDLSIVGRDFQVSEEPVGFVNAGDFAAAGAGRGPGSAACSACWSGRRS